MSIANQIKIEAVKHYLSGKTLKQTAATFKVHGNTLWRWVKIYRLFGFTGFSKRKLLTKHWKKLPDSIEDKIIMMKEAQPSLTVRRAQAMFREQHTKISLKGIWHAWQRCGLTGFAKEQLSDSYQDYLKMALPQYVLDTIKELIDRNKLKEAAGIINRLPVFPDDDLIVKIPYEMLSLRRKADYIRAEFGRLPLEHYCLKTVALRHELEKQKLFYSMLWVGVAECYALMWLGEPRRVMKLVATMKKRTIGIRDSRLRFILSLLEGQAYASQLRISEAKVLAAALKVIIRTSRNPHFFMGGLGGLYSTMGFFREAIYWTDKALQGAAPSYRQQLHVNLAGFLTTAGDYRSALASLKRGQLEEWGFHSRSSIIQAYAYLNKGDFQKAATHAINALTELKKEQLRRFIHPATFILACCHQAAGDKKEARQLLKEANPLLKKYNLVYEYLQRRMILGEKCASQTMLEVPGIRLIHLLQKAEKSMRLKDYRRALHYARTEKLFGLFMRLALFFPTPVLKMMDQGKNPDLPKAFLEMPVFRVDLPVYKIGFLGQLQVVKGDMPLYKINLGPKDAAFLVQMAVNKNRKLQLDDLYRNFWSGNKIPSRNLSHLLMRLRRKLMIPSHFIRIQYGALYWRIVFTTDYELFSETLTQAKVFARVGEWHYARRDYLRAFRLCRAAPFRNMYDNKSEEIRRAFLNRLESEIKDFAELCREHNEMNLYQRVRNRLVKVLPHLINSS